MGGGRPITPPPPKTERTVSSRIGSSRDSQVSSARNIVGTPVTPVVARGDPHGCRAAHDGFLISRGGSGTLLPSNALDIPEEDCATALSVLQRIIDNLARAGVAKAGQNRSSTAATGTVAS